MIIVGDEIVKSDALQEAAQLAETLGCPAYQSSTPYGAHFLSESPCFMGALARIQKLAREALSPYDLIIALGGDPLADVGLQRGRSAAGRALDRAGRPGRLGSRQELQRRDRAESGREGDPARAGAGAEGGRRRRARVAREAGTGGAGVEELDGEAQDAGRPDIQGRRSFADRSGLAGAAGGRGDARKRHPGRRGPDLVAADHRRCARTATATAIMRWLPAASAGDCRPRSASAWPIRIGRWCVTPAMAARCIRSSRCGPRRTTSCR